METAVLFFVAHPPGSHIYAGERADHAATWQGQEAAAGGAIAPLREWIIDLYAPYVLIRCAGFTNDRSQALMIGAYTLVTTCLMAERLDHLGQLGISVDVVVEVVGPDVVGGD